MFKIEIELAFDTKNRTNSAHTLNPINDPWRVAYSFSVNDRSIFNSGKIVVCVEPVDRGD